MSENYDQYQGQSQGQTQPQALYYSYGDISGLLQEHLLNVERSVQTIVQGEMRTLTSSVERQQQVGGNVSTTSNQRLVLYNDILDQPGWIGTVFSLGGGRQSPHTPGNIGSSAHNRELEEQRMMKAHNDEINSLSLQLGQKASELDQVRQQAETDRRTISNQLSREKEANRNLTDKLAKFREMLVKPSTDYVIDSVVMQKFSLLRSRILKIVRSTFETRLATNKLQPQLNDRQKEFFALLKTDGSQTKYFVNRIRGIIFSLLWEEILSRAVFGLDDSEELDKVKWALELLEDAFLSKLPKENLKEFVDWRMASSKCGSLLGGNTNLASETANKIWNFLKPVETIPGSEKKGKDLLLRLCEDAMELNSHLRSSRDVFEIRRSFKGPLEIHMDFVDEEADEELDPRRDSGDKPGDVAYCLFGALVKRTEEDPLKEIVLEKGLAVVYKA
ncbi:hypothetical protein GGR54DRAFT_653262 [Hypoxylon sp. NC1633]|nr:hypothetical protein GGR54DRAFT_653262 [Hypoxylon sp. NC1633]